MCDKVMLVHVLTKFLCYLYPSITDNDFKIRRLAVDTTVAIDHSDDDNETFYIKRIRRRRKIECLRQ